MPESKLEPRLKIVVSYLDDIRISPCGISGHLRTGEDEYLFKTMTCHPNLKAAEMIVTMFDARKINA
ncbi:hypothetical protein LCGC14_1214820 [marine sediment metagenome]|uniref:Uncharacterized protein n=1 Tax=marine sediment metagenome TaxID=412755 RepID=A0A0F9PHQ2_9ZZZZ